MKFGKKRIGGLRKGFRMSVSLVLCVILTGCGVAGTAIPGMGTGEKQPVIITVWNCFGGQQLETFNRMVQTFNEGKGKELGIYVESTSEGAIEDLNKEVLAADNKVGAAKIPNIFSSYLDEAVIWDSKGILANLDPYFSDAEKEEYLTRYIEDGKLHPKDGLKVFPVAKATEIMVVNKTDWDKFADATGADIDRLKTIEGVTELAEQYYEWTDQQTPEPDDGKSFFGRDAIANYILVGASQLGIEMITRTPEGETEIHFPKEVVRKLWDHYYVPYINGYFSALGRFRSDDMRMGSIITYVCSSAAATFIPGTVTLADNSFYPVEVVAMEAPQFEGGTRNAVQQGAGMVVSASDEAHEKASVEFLKWFSDTDNSILFSLETGYLPVKKAALEQDYVTGSDAPETVKKSLKAALETVNTNTMYSTDPVSSGSRLRTHLETSLSEKAKSDRKEILALMSNGMRRKQAVQLYDTEENFDEWYEEIKQELEAMK